MKTIFKKSFAKDLKRHSGDKPLMARIGETTLGVEGPRTK